MIRFGARVRIYLVTSEVAAYSKEGAYLFLEKMQMVVFVLGL